MKTVVNGLCQIIKSSFFHSSYKSKKKIRMYHKGRGISHSGFVACILASLDYHVAISQSFLGASLHLPYPSAQINPVPARLPI